MVSGRRSNALRALVLAALLAGCADDRPGVTIIGIDGADWQVIDPMLARGELPNIEALIRAGARAELRPHRPLLSPPIWTTIATGVSRHVHGIEDFDTPDGRLVSSRDREAPALWTLASRSGLRSAVVGWWATYPAEAIDGVIVSERALKTREEDIQHRFDDALLPPELAHLAHPAEALHELAATLFEMPERRPGESDGAWLLRRVRVEDEASARALLELRANDGPFDLELLLLRGVDPVSHVFWRYQQPDDEAYAALPALTRVEGVPDSPVAEHYRFVDGLVGEIVTRPSPKRVTFLLSDHGFEAAVTRREGRVTGTGHHRSARAGLGIFVAAGGPIAPGIRAEKPIGVYDVAPTVLHLLGLEIPRELMGRARLDLMDPDWVAEHPRRSRTDFEGSPTDLPADADPTDESAAERRLRDELRALGYVE